MSTLKVQSVQHTSAASPAITLDANGQATLNGLAFPTSGSLSGRNRIINGEMRIDQRNAGAAISGSSSGYCVDRWAYLQDSTNWTLQQSSAVPSGQGFANSLLITTTGTKSPSGSTYAAVSQRIEGFNISDLNWGTADAQAVTLSFWVRSSKTGIFTATLKNNSATTSYAAQYTIGSANTWQKFALTIPGPTIGSWATTSGIGTYVDFWLCGQASSGPPNTWTAGNINMSSNQVNLFDANGATFYITGVQLEAGTVATPFERRSYGAELSLCQRYFFAVKASENSDTYCRFVQGDLESTTVFTSCYTLPVRMRVTPTLTTTGTASNYAVYHAGAITACSTAPSVASGNSQTVVVLAVVSSGLSAGRGATIIANNNNTAYLYYGAEL